MEGYFVDSTNLESSPNIVFDSKGIPQWNYSSIGIQYNPVTLSQYALANYHTYLKTKNPTLRQRFLVQAEWLLQNAKQRGNFSVWEYTFDWPSFNCTNPWVSAMAQGQGLSVLIRAYYLTKNVSYLDIANKTVLSFKVDMREGGGRYEDSMGGWCEECADEGAYVGKVLNGFIFALLGLYEYYNGTNNLDAYELFCEGAETVSNNIHRYDSGSWSYYNLLHHGNSSLGYHELHIKQLSTLHEITGDETFLHYSQKFESYIE